MLLHRRDDIVLKAIEIIDEKGLQGLSTREIARRVGISEGTIFKHYRSKNDIILAVLDSFAMFDNDIIQTIELRKMPARKAISYFIGAYAEYFENYPALTAISESYNELSKNSALTFKTQEIFYHRFYAVRNMIEQAQEGGVIRADISCEELSDVIIGLFRIICLRWSFSGRKFSLKEHTLKTLNMLLDEFEGKRTQLES